MSEIPVNKDVETRIIKAINHIEPDRVPIWEALENPTLYNYFAPGEKDFLKAASITCEALSIDMTYGCMNPPLLGEEYDTPDVHVSGQTRWSKHPEFSSVNDIINHKPRKVKRTQEFVDRYLEGFYRLKEAYAPHTMYVSQGAGFDFLGIAHGSGIGWDVFTTLLYEAPHHLEKIWDERVDYAVMRNSVYAEYQLAPVMQFCEDLSYKGGLLISPEHIRKYFIPRLKRTIQPLKEAGIKLIFHCDGNLMDILEDLIEAGIDGLNPIDPSAGMDIGFIKQKYGDKLILVGNVDGSRILPFGTPEEVREEVASCIRKASPGGGHLIQCGCGELMPDVPLENALAYFNAVEEFGKYPIKV
jgi:hypothetical protein